MTFSTSFSKKENSNTDTIVVGIFDGGTFSQAAESLDKRTNGMISANIKGHRKFKGKIGQALSMAISVDSAVRIILVGLGNADDLNNLSFETRGGKLFDMLKASSAVNIAVHLDGIEDLENTTTAEIAAHFALGFKLKSYNFDKYKTKSEDSGNDMENICFITDAHTAAEKLSETLDHIAGGVFLARDLINEPPNTLHPESYSELIKEELKPLGVEVEILDEKKMHKLGFEALLAVGQGSIRESRTVIMRWNGAGKGKKSTRAPLALVGKGVTFDTGGISLKPGANMDEMKYDMCGAATVFGTFVAVAEMQLPINLVMIVPAVENMPDGDAYRPGDVITSYSGKTIEVLNTDAEGRMILCDALTYAQEYKPQVLIDLATLTGACVVALGHVASAVMSKQIQLPQDILQAGIDIHDRAWQLPLWDDYQKQIDTTFADMQNVGGFAGGSITAGCFLSRFCEDINWAHIDIAGTAWASKKDGATGRPVAMMVQYLINESIK